MRNLNNRNVRSNGTPAWLLKSSTPSTSNFEPFRFVSVLPGVSYDAFSDDEYDHDLGFSTEREDSINE